MKFEGFRSQNKVPSKKSFMWQMWQKWQQEKSMSHEENDVKHVREVTSKRYHIRLRTSQSAKFS